MKKLVLLLLLGVAVSFASTFSDVPVNHWAYEAVSELSRMGVISGMPDGTFQGNNPMTRYQVAVALKKLMDLTLDRIESAVSADQIKTALNKLSTMEELVSTALMKSQQNKEQLSTTDKTLQTLLNEVSNLKTTIVEISKVRQELSAMISTTDDKLTGQYNDLALRVSSVEKSISEIESRVSAKIVSDLKGSINSLSERLDFAMNSFDSVKSDVASLSQRMSDIETSVEALNTLKQSFVDLEGRMATLETQVASDINSVKKALETTANQLDARLSLVEGQISSLKTDVDKLNSEVNNFSEAAKKISRLEENIGTVAGQVVSTNKRVGELEQDVSDLQQTVNSKPWKSDVEAAVVESTKKVDDTYTMAMLGVVAGIAGVVVGLIGLLAAPAGQ